VQCAGGSKGGIAKLLGSGNGEDKVVGCKSLRHDEEVDGDAGCDVLVAGHVMVEAVVAYPAVIAKCRRAHI
jgi:hypothetical protein